MDTPVEPLHTHLLGVVKYFWAQTVWVLEKEGKFDTFQTRLNSLSKAGLRIPNILADYMCRYRGSLMCKHFKTISQVISAAFAICGLVDSTLQAAWNAVGYLTVLLWETEIENLEEYLVSQGTRPLTEEELRGVARTLVDALRYLRGELILHRDIKPTNILLTRDFRLVNTQDEVSIT